MEPKPTNDAPAAPAKKGEVVRFPKDTLCPRCLAKGQRTQVVPAGSGFSCPTHGPVRA